MNSQIFYISATLWQKFYKSYQNLTNFLDRFVEICVISRRRRLLFLFVELTLKTQEQKDKYLRHKNI